MNDNIKDLLEGQRIRERLRRAGIYPMVGPRGPKGDKGDGISIIGDYNSYELTSLKRQKISISLSMI